jgi:hypothetical protein
MIYVDSRTQKAFNENWKDWCLGGPKRGGWTRSGMRTPCHKVNLLGYRCVEMSVEEVLGKNRMETQRWHIDFLQARLDQDEKFFWKNTAYYWEYLKSRYDNKEGYRRALSFIDLLGDIADRGVHRSVWVADIQELDLGFRYFRFDGTHRTCAAKVCGFDTVPAILFETEVCWGDFTELDLPSTHGRERPVLSGLKV